MAESSPPWTKEHAADGLWLLMGGKKVARIVDERASDDIIVDFILAGLNWAAEKNALGDMGVSVDEPHRRS